MKVQHGSTWWYNPSNAPTGYNSADQCDLCHDGATLATFRTDKEKIDMVDGWAMKISNDEFWFGYSIEPGKASGCARAAAHTAAILHVLQPVGVRLPWLTATARLPE